jgi:hypothetical protein
MRNLDPLRDVVTYRFSQSKYCKPGQGRWEISLACGHRLFPKASTKVGKRARCFWCSGNHGVAPTSDTV